MWKRLNTFLNHHEYLLVLLLLTIVLRLPSLMEPVWSGDEAIYLAIGQRLADGGKLYQSISDYPVKPPGMYLLATWLPSVGLLRFAVLLLSLVGTAAFWRLAGWFFDNHTARWFASLGYVLLMSTPILEGTLTNAETFFVPLGLAAMSLILPRPTSRWTWGAAGVLLASAVWFKAPAAADIFVVIGAGWLLVNQSHTKVLARTFISLLGGMAVGILGLLFISSPYVSWQGYLDASKEVAGYLQAWHADATQSRVPLGLGRTEIRLAVIGILTLGLVYLAKPNRTLQLSLWWLGLTLAAAMASGRPYAHYLLHPLPAVIVVATQWWLSLTTSRSKALITSCTLGGLAALWWIFGFTVWPVRAYYQAAVARALGGSEQAYLASFDPLAVEWHQAGQQLRNLVPVGSQLFIWGELPQLYVLSQRPPAAEFVTSYHYRELPTQAETLSDLRANYLVIDMSQPRPASVENLLSHFEHRASLSNRYHLYRRWQ